MTEPRLGAIARVIVTLDPKDADFLKRQASRMLRRAIHGGGTWQRWAAVLDALGAAELAPPRPRALRELLNAERRSLVERRAVSRATGESELGPDYEDSGDRLR